MKSNAERIESVKSGIVGAIAFTLTYTGMMGLQIWLLSSSNGGISLIIQSAIAAVTGFLFALTYRYIIRTDDNDHLKDGAVLAFGLVRGLVPLELIDDLSSNLLILCLMLAESIACFAITRLVLDFCLQKQWIKPFN